MFDLVRQALGGLFAFAVYSVVLIWIARLFPEVSQLVRTLLVGLVIAAPGAGIVLYILD